MNFILPFYVWQIVIIFFLMLCMIAYVLFNKKRREEIIKFIKDDS